METLEWNSPLLLFLKPDEGSLKVKTGQIQLSYLSQVSIIQWFNVGVTQLLEMKIDRYY